MLRKRLSCGETVCGMMLCELYVPNIVRLIKACGFDFIIIDCEHGYFDYTQVANLTAVAEGIDMPVIVSVARPDRTAITKYMDIGARGILLANTENASDIYEVVQFCRYAPQGARGVSTFRAHTGYAKRNIIEIMHYANECNLVICQIESPKGVEHCEELLNVEGLDGVIVGPNDLSQCLGLLKQYDNPMMTRSLESITKAARMAGKWSGIITADNKLLTRSIGLGMTCFSVGSELSMLAAGARAFLEEFRQLKGE